MKLLYPDSYVLGVTANEENANFPDDNVLDDHPKKVWKATSADAKLSCSVEANANCIVVFGTNATSVSVSVRESLGLSWGTEIDWGTEINWVEQVAATTLYDLSDSAVGALWAEYTAKTVRHVVDLDFTAGAGTVIEAGVVKAGIYKSFTDAFSIGEGLDDYSIRKRLNNGALYYRKRDVVRRFRFSVREDRAADFYTFMHSVARLIGPKPIAWRLVSEHSTDWEWVVFAGFEENMPSGSHDWPHHSRIEAEIMEVI